MSDERTKAIGETIAEAADIDEMLAALGANGWTVLCLDSSEYDDPLVAKALEQVRASAGFNPQWGVSLATVNDICSVLLDELSLGFTHVYANEALHGRQ